MLKTIMQTNAWKTIMNATNEQIMSNLALYNRFREVPQEAKKTIKGGKLNGFTDINPMWRIKKLTEEFGECGFGWYYEEVERWKETCGQEVAVFVKINLYIKRNNEWSQPIMGVGGSKMVQLFKGGDVVDFSDEAYKMALTDAISIACKALGMAADVYFANDRTKYDSQPAQASQPSAAVQARREAAGRGAKQPQKAPYAPVSNEVFWRMVANYVHGNPTTTGQDYRTAWIANTNAGEQEIAMFDRAVQDYMYQQYVSAAANDINNL